MRKTLWNSLAIGLVCITVCHAASPDEIISVSEQIDRLVEQGCQASGSIALAPATDAEFLRRVWLDLAGKTPPLADATRLASRAKLDRAEVVQQLLQSEDFCRHWGRLWTVYLTDRRPFEAQEYDGRKLLHFVTQSLRDGRSYAELMSNLLLSEGTSEVGGSANFILRYDAAAVPLAGALSQKFLGLSLHCAECHDHPHAPWKQKDFWGLAAHFARLRKLAPAEQAENDFVFAVIERPRGELMAPQRPASSGDGGDQPMKTVFPQLLGGPRSDGSKQRRTVLVDWLAQPTNPYPSRHLVNVVWERLLGAKLIENFDHWPDDAVGANRELLNLLADDCVQHQWDVRRLIQAIVLSKTYQRSSHDKSRSPVDAETKDSELLHWGRARVRPLSADQLYLSVAQAFGYYQDDNDHRLAELTGEEFTQDIPENNLGSDSLTLGRSVSMYNSEYIQGAVEMGTEATVRLYGASIGPAQIERLCLSLLTRPPTRDELEFFEDLGGEGDPREGIQDVIWVLLNSTEFVTNH